VKGTKTQTSKKEGREPKHPNTPESICFLLNTIQVRKNVLWDYVFLLFALRSEFWDTVENVLRFSPGLDTTVDSPFHILY
jgi:hypothetical protein